MTWNFSYRIFFPLCYSNCVSVSLLLLCIFVLCRSSNEKRCYFLHWTAQLYRRSPIKAVSSGKTHTQHTTIRVLLFSHTSKCDTYFIARFSHSHTHALSSQSKQWVMFRARTLYEHWVYPKAKNSRRNDKNMCHIGNGKFAFKFSWIW